MGIKENLEKAREVIVNDDGGLGEVATALREAAIEAITHGIDSEQGKRYMALFCDTPNELLQLTVVRDTDEDYMPRMRAYMPADAICLPDTNTQFTTRVDEDVEPPPGADVASGVIEPSAIRDNALATKLRGEG